jgi:holo-[acyl-carrier protein] synthase
MTRHREPAPMEASTAAIAVECVPSGGLRCGIDLVDVESFRRCLVVGGERFLRRVFTPAELDHCRDSTERLAAHFACKEAAAKMLGTGIRGVGWQDIEVLTAAHGEPTLILRGRAIERARDIGLQRWAISISHERHSAISYVVGWCSDRKSRSPRQSKVREGVYVG